MTESVSEREAHAEGTGQSGDGLSAAGDTGGAVEIAGIDAKVLLGETTKIESSTPGGFLRQERERQERPLQQIADELHLSRSAIEAIEGNRFTEFGAPVFAKGHLRRYATLLRVSADDVLARYEQLSESARAHESLPPAARAHEPARRVELTREATGLRIAPRSTGHGIRWVPATLFVTLLIVSAAAAWWWISMRGPTAAHSVVEQTAQPTAMEEADDLPTEVAQALTQSASAEIDAPSTASTASSAASSTASSASAPATTSAPIPTPAIETRAPAATSPMPGKVRVRLIFKQDSWAEVYDGRGNRMMYDVGRSDLPRVIDADPPVQVVLGFAPAVDVEINGVAKKVPERLVNNSVARFAVHADGRMQ